jgi:hypothetical protein
VTSELYNDLRQFDIGAGFGFLDKLCSMLLRRLSRLSIGATNLPLIQMCQAFGVADADSVSQIVYFG